MSGRFVYLRKETVMTTTFFDSFMSGAQHPVYGLDHILAMLVVGVWALQIGGRAIWAVPLGFVGTMAVGFIAARAGLSLPLVEPIIVASSIALGLGALFALRPSVPIAVALTSFFGLFHGHAHGVELGEAAPLAFGLGFVLITAALHASGIVLAGFMRQAHRFAPRALGAVSALVGLSLVFG
ncbi:HupE/UreJ family protein [Pacificibacter marinus]|nr:HupE/UreJ family protein [Pacificibacter marinus]